MIVYVALAILLFLAIIVISIEHHWKKVQAAILVLVALLIYFSIVGIFSSDEVSLDSPKGIVGGIYYYFGWLGDSVGEIWDIGSDTATAVGNVVRFNQTETNDGRR